MKTASNASLRFGNTFDTIRPGLVTMTVVGMVLGVVAYAATASNPRPWLDYILLTFVPPVGFLSACAPTLLLSIRIEEGRVRHVFLNGIILSDFPLADFISIEFRRFPWAAVLIFTNGRAIRFFGAHLAILGSLRAALADGRMPDAG